MSRPQHSIAVTLGYLASVVIKLNLVYE